MKVRCVRASNPRFRLVSCSQPMLSPNLTWPHVMRAHMVMNLGSKLDLYSAMRTGITTAIPFVRASTSGEAYQPC